MLRVLTMTIFRLEATISQPLVLILLPVQPASFTIHRWNVRILVTIDDGFNADLYLLLKAGVLRYVGHTLVR